MRPMHIALIALCCVVWGANASVTRWSVGIVPPIFLAFIRFFGVALLLSPFLRHIPRQFGLVFLISNCIGGFNFFLLFLAFKHSNASAVAIVGQLGLPIATVLSIIFLGETVRWRRTLGMVLAFIGVMVVVYKPGMKPEIGLIYAFFSAFAGAVGTILMKRLIPIGVFQLQAWVALMSLIPLGVGSLFLEHGQIQSIVIGGPWLWAALAFSVLGVSIFGHSAYYYLVKENDVTQVMPFTLMVPIWAVIFSTIFLKEPITIGLLIGGALCICGVWVIAMRENHSLPKETIATAREV